MLLAIDAGGTHTRGAILDASGRVLATGEGGPANWSTLGDRAVEGIRAAIEGARSAAGGGAQLKGACVALAGYYPPWHEPAVASALAPLLGCPLRLETDLRAAWAGATGLAAGVVVAAGTGSVAYGEDGMGRATRAGGWGPLAGDEGSAPWIGAAALRAIGRQLDGRGPKTELARLLPAAALPDSRGGRVGQQNAAGQGSSGSAVLERQSTREDEAAQARHCHGTPEGPKGSAWTTPEGTQGLELWLRGLYRDGWGREEIGALAPRVAAAAASGDRVAMRILEEAAASLGELALAVLSKLGLERGPAPVSAVGGVFAAGDPVTRPFRRWLAGVAPAAMVVPALLSPLGGAALLALERFSEDPPPVASDARSASARPTRVLSWIEELADGGPLFVASR
jgi:N-acetylglucosamine kinase-like BadF-type ATPase